MAQNIDTYFKEKLEHRTFELKDTYWQEAAALLDAEEEKKKRGVFFWWTGGLLGLALLSFMFFNKTTAINTNEHITVENKSILNNSVEKESIATLNKPEKEENNKIEKSTGNIVPQKINANNSFVSKGLSESKKETTFNTPINKSINEIITTKNDISKDEKSPIINQPILTKKELTAPNNLEHLLILVNEEEKDEEELPTNNVNGCLQPSPWHFGVTAAQLMQTYPKSGENLITGFHAGIIGQYDLNKNWFVSTSLGYTRRGGHYEAAKMTETRNYRFGLELMEEQLKPTSLHYATSTLSAGWKKGHHLFEGGIVLDYLAGVRGELGKIERIEGDEPTKDFVPYAKGWVDEEGITTFNVSPMIGYRYRVNKELSFGLTMQYAVRPLTNKTPEMGDYILKENDRFNLRLNAVYLIK